ncbi:MAG: DUF1972 domain-containing protein [Bacteroidales bacterium]|nr:DUF1972 domain-containing protein [Bacteroidales bacterium]
MNISIVGTRGIPNRYGGFEQLAQHLSLELVKKGYSVAVYTPSYRTDVKNLWHNVNIRKIRFIRFFGALYHFVYDYLSINDALNKEDDIIIICGYVSSFPALFLFKKHKSKFIIHTDGWEWKRKKWNIISRFFIKFCEKFVAQNFPYLLSDHVIIQQYYLQKYHKQTFCIAYGFSKHISYKSLCNNYYLVIARNEKENQIDLIVRAFLMSNSSFELWVFTNKPVKTYHSNKIRTFQNIFDEEFLNNIRMHAKAYIHAYTVGGTNPSLIEAMAYSKLIIAFDNSFHRTILNNYALYFKTDIELSNIFILLENKNITFTEFYKNEVNSKYQWSIISEHYVSMFNQILTHEKVITK